MRNVETEIVEVPATTKTVRHVTVTCDLCQSPATKRCRICDRDLCRKCTTYLDHDPITGYDYGDYWLDICRQCHEIADEFEPTAVARREVHEKELDALDEALQAKCVAWKASGLQPEHGAPRVTGDSEKSTE